MPKTNRRTELSENFIAVLNFLILLPLLLVGFFFIVLGLKLKVFNWETVIAIDLIMTFGYVIGWFILKFYLLKVFKKKQKKEKKSKANKK